MTTQKFADRLHWVITAHLRMKPTPFARRSGLSPGYISDILKGKRPAPGPDIIQRISSESGVRYEWLLRGEGDPFANPREPTKNWLLDEDAPTMRTIREGPAGAARKMSDHELLAELGDQFKDARQAKPYMRAAHKEILCAFFEEMLARIDKPKENERNP